MCIHAMQALSDLTSECEAAAAYILANADTVKHTADDKQSAREKEPAGTEMSWKWDILRPIKSALPSS